ncbi:(-)-germacrene D synthase-like [Prunus yedoensis var. nudiflora]|uniref:(-)-germacrene D synthase-like n=1 Tax=Prunus yedoensis var. nudiflora TaxID=2094558 RepID=A0A314ZGQ4_PRUYE|nr:(-)-germacrene D synthase-like [Prunus yedoensis var. nudiflora]
MSVQVSLASDQPQTPKATPDYVNRRCANFSPSIWGYHFLSYASVETNIKAKQRAQELKEKVKMIIMAPVKKPSQKLDLIDDIQRLGVSHHFENEIEELLQQIHNSSHDNTESGDQETDNELYTAALRFRLLRQQGYNISCDIFNNFKDGDGKFKESLVNDVVGLLSLYEATHLRIHGEDILDEALTFTTTHLESATHRLSPILLKQVTHAMWWKDLDFVNKLPFARDRVVESYFWASGVHFEPQYYFARRTLCKVTALLVIIDDIYDVYGTHEELELFTEAVERWDISAMDHLPEYMKVCYQALLDVYVEIEENLANEGNLYSIHYAREAMKVQVRAYFREAKWLHQKYTPTMDEYMSAALDTSYFMMATTSFVGMGDIATKDSMDWVFNDPTKMVKAASLIGRLIDDIKSHQFEQKRGHVASAVECYMKEYGATEEEANIELSKQVNNAWKDINEACIQNTTIPMPLLLRILNLARAIEVIYKHDDGFTHAGIFLKDSVVSLFVEPVPL